MALTPQAFQFVSDFVRREAAIVLEPGKEYLVESRLAPVARKAGFPTLDAFLDHIRTAPKSSPLFYQIVDALTTNETLFFRDHHPFEALKKDILPQLIESRKGVRKLSIWSAASSTGQEAYSLAMLIRDQFPQIASWNVRILGTDLSTTVLDQAKSGSYSQLEVNRGLPAPMLIKYFDKVDGRWVIKEDLRKMCEFRAMNLTTPWPMMQPFDLIFIRNVLIYFDTATKQGILKRMKTVLLPHGSLFLGTAETTINLDPEWVPVKAGNTTVFRVGGAAAATGASAGATKAA
ncbi:MAG: protein-glutamate O-methyltransferase CheR [Candidatus Eisenbacteria bacterium]|nr:protein-glutamate O-methyltransferase CheR [Candidatus Eisenbacteria bacterium]